MDRSRGEYLHNLVAQGSTTVKYESRQQTIDDFKDFRNMFMIIGGVLCLVIGVRVPLLKKLAKEYLKNYKQNSIIWITNCGRFADIA